MPFHLVDETLTLHILADEAAYRAYVTRRKHLKMSNMLELIGMGRAVAAKHPQKSDHMMLPYLMWLKRDAIAGVVPLVGSYHHMFNRLQRDHKIKLAYATVKDLFNGSKKQIKDKDGTVWKKTVQPFNMQLMHGASIVELAAAASAVPLRDYALEANLIQPDAPIVPPDPLAQVGSRRARGMRTYESCTVRAQAIRARLLLARASSSLSFLLPSFPPRFLRPSITLIP